MAEVNLNTYLGALFGVGVGDAVGVPVEFKSREEIKKSPITDMIGYGTYNLPPGTFSDDGSLTFCLAEALTKDYDLYVIAENFIFWRYSNYWAARGKVFDIGNTTQRAIDRLLKGITPDLAGDFEEDSNGNGALMRILPIIFYVKHKPTNERFKIIKEVASITHGHIRSTISCFYYIEFGLGIINGLDKFQVYANLQKSVPEFLVSISINKSEIEIFNRLFDNQINLLNEAEISSSGYVIHSLEASIWCLLQTENYKDAVLKAANLGNDTDTVAAITGGLAGLYFGYNNIPKNWISTLARNKDIENLALGMFEHIETKGA